MGLILVSFTSGAVSNDYSIETEPFAHRHDQAGPMTARSYLETDGDDVRHGDADGQREILVRYEQEPERVSAKRATITKPVSTKLVCSCGSSKCPAITRYGLPLPMFDREIRPITSQIVRDERARTLRQTVVLETV
jgi:hypothetical protein